LPWRTAHQIVGILVRFSYERGLKPHQVTPELLDEAAVEYMGESIGLPSDILQKALDPVAFVNGRTLYGGPAPEECQRRMPEYRAQLQDDQTTLTEKQQRLMQAREAQETAIDALLA
jgi:argininosuccinate lyase